VSGFDSQRQHFISVCNQPHRSTQPSTLHRRWALISPDGVAPSWMVGVSASVNLPLHHNKVLKFSSGTGSPGWSWEKGGKMVLCVTNVQVYLLTYLLIITPLGLMLKEFLKSASTLAKLWTSTVVPFLTLNGHPIIVQEN